MRSNFNDGAGDLGLGPKTSRTNFSDRLYASVKLCHHAEQAHFAGIGHRGESLRHFALNSDMHAHAVWKVIEQNGNERRCRLIGQVGDHAKWTALDGLGE